MILDFSFIPLTNDRIIWSQGGKGGLKVMQTLSCFALADLLHQTSSTHLVLKVCLFEICTVKSTPYSPID